MDVCENIVKVIQLCVKSVVPRWEVAINKGDCVSVKVNFKCLYVGGCVGCCVFVWNVVFYVSGYSTSPGA